MIYTTFIDTPIGALKIEASSVGLVSVLFVDDKKGQSESQGNDICTQAASQLTAYFEGELKQFELPLAAQGTEFQHSVWNALTNIPYAHTCTYGDIAQCIGNPNASRAVGMANRNNPISIIVPCHRVIGANQSLTGYAGGLERKAWLLAHENKYDSLLTL